MCVFVDISVWTCVCVHAYVHEFIFVEAFKAIFASKFDVVCASHLGFWIAQRKEVYTFWKERTERRRCCEKYSHHSRFSWLNYCPGKVYSECHTIQNRRSPPPPPISALIWFPFSVSSLPSPLAPSVLSVFFPAKSLLPHRPIRLTGHSKPVSNLLLNHFFKNQ